MSPHPSKSSSLVRFDPGLLELIVFDFDGTLAELTIDFVEMRRLITELARGFGYDLESSGQPYVLEAIDAAAKALGPQGTEFRARAEDVLVDLEVASAESGRLFSGVREGLEALGRAGLRRAVITRNCRRAVEILFPDLYGWCEVFLPRDDAPKPKPAPEHLSLVLEKLNTRAEKTLMVGDHPIDVATGRAVGTWTCGLPTGRMGRDDLGEADVVYEDLGELVEVITRGRG